MIENNKFGLPLHEITTMMIIPTVKPENGYTRLMVFISQTMKDQGLLKAHVNMLYLFSS